MASVDSPYQRHGTEGISADGRTAYATVTFADRAENLDKGEVQAVVDTAKAAEAKGLDVELGGTAVSLTKSSGGHVAEIVGVAVAAVVLFLAFGSSPPPCCPSPPP